MRRLIILLFSLTLALFAANDNNQTKMTLLYVEMDNCPWCKKMDHEVFDVESFISSLQKMYNVKRVKRGTQELPLSIKPKYYPTTYILSDDNSKIIDELPGYMKAKDYLEYLKTLNEIENDQ